ncbi:MAG: TAXI family TRAP transporter solute-binding subunit [Burkholderiales bacterium]|jgi:TRAP transporter TAXI family solute receptor|nr:TAXI family TRAP transporter solute-binding subunit [Burkholderiales bacterium]
MKFSQFLRGLLVVATGLVLASGAAAQQKFVNILTGGQAGVYYPLGVALSQVYGKAIPDAKATVQATKASVENLNLLQAGRGELAFTLGDSLSDAWRGVEDAGFKSKLDRLRTVAGIYSNYIQIVASGDSGIKTLADLKGKRISVGAPRSGTELNARAILKAAGISYADFAKVEYLSFAESVELMKNRQLDVTLQSAGLGVASIRDLATSIKVVVVPIPADVVAKVGDPAYAPGTIPAGTYTGQTEAVATATIKNFLVTHAGVPDDTVCAMTKATFDSLDTLVAAHSAAKGIVRSEANKGLPVPLHPGAERYFATSRC